MCCYCLKFLHNLNDRTRNLFQGLSLRLLENSCLPKCSIPSQPFNQSNLLSKSGKLIVGRRTNNLSRLSNSSNVVINDDKDKNCATLWNGVITSYDFNTSLSNVIVALILCCYLQQSRKIFLYFSISEAT